ncbi:MAG: PHP domain-containing protein, partial [Oscillospiraceae bacterium]|nr:PHP domain-containing protein [Oscillospiraceae bacterium]
MRPVSNAHVHTSWCDGENTADEMARAAIGLGFSAIGFSSHAKANFETSCPGVSDVAGYLSDISAQKEKYIERLAVFRGLEQDDYALAERREDYDYIIQSTHYFPELE